MTAPAEHVRITLDFIQIIDSLHLGMDGEFRFEFSVSSVHRGLLQESRLPESGTLSISRRPAMNWIGYLDHLLWDGMVKPGEVIILDAQGGNVDRFSRSDPVQSYRREFSGNPDIWAGRYGPLAEGTKALHGPEDLEQWRLGYTIEVEPAALAQLAGAPR